MGAKEEERDIYVFPGVNLGRASIIGSDGGMRAERVTVTTLDSFFRNLTPPPPRIDMIKIDVEGFEYEVLSGARTLLRSHQAILCVECDDEMPRSNSALGMTDIFDLIMQAGDYRLYQLAASKFGQVGTLSLASDIRQIPRHDNAIFLPESALDRLPSSLFQDRTVRRN